MWSAPRPGRFNHCAEGWISLGAGLDSSRKSRPTGIRSLGPPTGSESLYRLRYPGRLQITALSLKETRVNNRINLIFFKADVPLCFVHSCCADWINLVYFTEKRSTNFWGGGRGARYATYFSFTLAAYKTYLWQSPLRILFPNTKPRH
jgi:hypothetical protein